MSPFAHPKEETLKHPWKKAAALCLAAVLCLAPAAQTLNMLWDDLVETAPRPPAARGETAQVLSSMASAVVSGVVDLVFAIYLLAGKEKLQSQCTEAVILGALCAAASSESRG